VGTRFTQGAAAVLVWADREARRFGHEYVGTEHILLGLLREGPGGAADVLRNLGADVGKVRQEVPRVVQTLPGADPVAPGRLPRSPRAARAIRHAVEEAGDLGRRAADTEHLLLGLLREPDGVAVQVLHNLGVAPAAVRAGVRRLAVDPTWLCRNGGAAAALARGVAAERAWAGLPALADALEEAGCEDPDVLAHLRRGSDHGCGPGGCRVLDRLLAAAPPVAGDPAPVTRAPGPAPKWWKCSG
jgi:hypothetical protein